MKQNTIIFLGLLVLVLGMASGCNKNEDRNENGDSYAYAANVPLTCGNGNYQAQLWTGYRQHGFYPYGNFAGYANGYYGPHRRSHGRNYAYQQNYSSQWGYAQNQGFCGCPSGFMPACDGDYGMTCVSSNQYRDHRYPVYSYNGSQFDYHGYGQISPLSGYQSNSCYNQVTVTCRMDDVHACRATGGYCQPSRNGSPYGICVY